MNINQEQLLKELIKNIINQGQKELFIDVIRGKELIKIKNYYKQHSLISTSYYSFLLYIEDYIDEILLKYRGLFNIVEPLSVKYNSYPYTYNYHKMKYEYLEYTVEKISLLNDTINRIKDVEEIYKIINNKSVKS